MIKALGIFTGILVVLGLLLLSMTGRVTADEPQGFGSILKKSGLHMLDGRYWRYDPRDTRAHASAHTSMELHVMSKVAPLSKEEVPRVAGMIRECVKDWPHWQELKHVSVVFHEPLEDGRFPRRAQLDDIYTYAWVGAGVRDDGRWTWSGKWRGESIASPRREGD